MTEERLREWKEIRREEGNDNQFDQYLQLADNIRNYHGTLYIKDPDREKWISLKAWIRAVADGSLDDHR